MAKISNILYMIDLLNTGNVYTIKDLSEKIGVTERMIRYYKNEICNNGIAIESFKGPNGGLINSNYFQNSNFDICDDNVLTGKTLQLAINSLYDCDITVGNICIVRYPGINRIDQMFLNNTATIDFHLFFDYIYGLCYHSPYSWKDNEWEKLDGKVDYEDTLGVFDLNRKKIIECIIKNHDYRENSEVGEYKRRLLK